MIFTVLQVMGIGVCILTFETGKMVFEKTLGTFGSVVQFSNITILPEIDNQLNIIHSTITEKH